MNPKKLLVAAPLVAMIELHCGGGETAHVTTPAPTTSASAPPAASSAAAVESGPIQCPAPNPPKSTTASAAPATCPDLGTDGALAKLDFGKAFHVDAKLGKQLKENARLTAALHDLTARVDASIQSACAKMLSDFGCTANYGGMQDTCDAASKVLEEAKRRLGASARVTPSTDQPECSLASQPALDCLHQCDPSFKGKATALKCDGRESTAGCNGVWYAPGVSDACAATCAMKLTPQATCTPSHVELKIDGASDAKEATLLQTVVDQDLHGVLVVEAARGRVDEMAKMVVNVMKALAPALEKAEAQHGAIAECYDGVTTNETLGISDVADEQVVGLRVQMALMKQKE